MNIKAKAHAAWRWATRFEHPRRMKDYFREQEWIERYTMHRDHQSLVASVHQDDPKGFEIGLVVMISGIFAMSGVKEPDIAYGTWFVVHFIVKCITLVASVFGLVIIVGWQFADLMCFTLMADHVLGRKLELANIHHSLRRITNHADIDKVRQQVGQCITNGHVFDSKANVPILSDIYKDEAVPGSSFIVHLKRSPHQH